MWTSLGTVINILDDRCKNPGYGVHHVKPQNNRHLDELKNGGKKIDNSISGPSVDGNCQESYSNLPSCYNEVSRALEVTYWHPGEGLG